VQEAARADVLRALEEGEAKKKAPIVELFADVYDEPTAPLLRQRAEMLEHVAKYGEEYKLEEYED